MAFVPDLNKCSGRAPRVARASGGRYCRWHPFLPADSWVCRADVPYIAAQCRNGRCIAGYDNRIVMKNNMIMKKC